MCKGMGDMRIKCAKCGKEEQFSGACADFRYVRRKGWDILRKPDLGNYCPDCKKGE